jgi:hypothetical protein
MPPACSSKVKRHFFTEVGSAAEPTKHKAVCIGDKCKADYLWTTSTGSLRKHLLTKHPHDLWLELQRLEGADGMAMPASAPPDAMSSSSEPHLLPSSPSAAVRLDRQPSAAASSSGRVPYKRRLTPVDVVDVSEDDAERALAASPQGSQTWFSPLHNAANKRVQVTPTVTPQPLEPASRSSLKQQSLQQSLQPSLEATWRRKLAEMFSCHSLPTRLISSPQFIEHLQLFRQCPKATIPSVWELGKEQVAAFDSLKVKVRLR